jgi:hypothetical protein
MNTRFALLLSVALSAVAGAAHAQEVDEFGPYGSLENRYRAPILQRFAFELRIGPYTPRVDATVSGSPYETTFGDSQRWSGGLEADWQALRLHKVLSFGPGANIAYTSASGNGFLASGAGRSGQESTLNILPVQLGGVLRIDALADNTPIPLVPYAKAGLGGALWWSNDGGETAEDDASGTDGSDFSYGWFAAAGLMLRLDFLDQDDANSARAFTGLDHSYLFAEWNSCHLDGFGSGDTMDVGADTYLFGVAVEAIF